MAPRRKTLADAAVKPAVPSPAAPEAVAPPAAPAGRPPSRAHTKAVAGHFDPAVSQKLRILAAQKDTTVQELLREAINDLFQKYNESRIV